MAALLLVSQLARAGSAVVTYQVDAVGQVTVTDVVVSAGPAPRGAATDGPLGALEVRGDGVTRARVGLDDPRWRSVITPSGGEATRLPAAQGRVVVPWPAGSEGVRVDGGPERRARAAPPPPVVGVVPVQLAGDPAERLDLVFLGDGYPADEMGRFAADVQAVVDHLGGVEPYAAYTALLNIWRVETPSAASGVSHPETGVVVDSALGCAYSCGGIDRLICCDEAAVLEAAGRVGAFDGVLVLVNDPVYGGSGGFTYATAYTGTQGVDVAAHELGHSLVLLRDEYSYGVADETAFTGPNCTADPDAPTWAQWLGVDGVDAYETCSYTNLWRPTENGCLMRTLQDGYCPVCREAAVRALYTRVPSLVVAVDPPVDTPVDARGSLDPEISVETVVPADQLTFVWTLNGAPIPGETGPTLRPRCRDWQGAVAVAVRDETPWVRDDPLGLLQAEAGPWTVLSERCAVPRDDRGCGGCDGTGGAAAGAVVLVAAGAARIRRRR